MKTAIAVTLAIATLTGVCIALGPQPDEPIRVCKHAVKVFERAYTGIVVDHDKLMAACLQGYELYRRTHKPESCQMHLSCVMAGATPDEIMICDSIP